MSPAHGTASVPISLYCFQNMDTGFYKEQRANMLRSQIVCFLDYNDFFSYNFPAEDLIGRDTPRPALDVGEATRILQMNLKVYKIEPPGPDDGQDLPVVHFKGVTRSLDDSFDGNGNSHMRGEPPPFPFVLRCHK